SRRRSKRARAGPRQCSSWISPHSTASAVDETDLQAVRAHPLSSAVSQIREGGRTQIACQITLQRRQLFPRMPVLCSRRVHESLCEEFYGDKSACLMSAEIWPHRTFLLLARRPSFGLRFFYPPGHVKTSGWIRMSLPPKMPTLGVPQSRS